MRYVLTIDEDGRIWSSVPEKYAIGGGVVADSLPDGNICDYLYVNGEYVYEPLPEPEHEEAEPTTEEILNAMLGVSE